MIQLKNHFKPTSIKKCVNKR